MSGESAERVLRVLVVDDSDDDVVLLTEALREVDGIELLRAVHSGDAALAYLRRQGPYSHAERPGLILLDVNMPGKTGFEVLAQLKHDPELRDIPVVMLSTSALQSDVDRALACGAQSYITKPSSFELLRGEVCALVKYRSVTSPS